MGGGKDNSVQGGVIQFVEGEVEDQLSLPSPPSVTNSSSTALCSVRVKLFFFQLPQPLQRMLPAFAWVNLK